MRAAEEGHARSRYWAEIQDLRELVVALKSYVPDADILMHEIISKKLKGTHL